MGPLKSQVEIYLDLCTQLICDDPLGTSESKHTSWDVETVKSRYTHEGLSFVTKTLPKLGRALDMALESGRFTAPKEFKVLRGRSNPAFLQVYFNLVFDEDGLLLAEPSVGAIKHLRQVLYFAYKLELPYSSSEELRVINSFVETDEQLAGSLSEKALKLLELASLITSDIFKDFDPMDIVPKHGPGAVATGERLDRKWVFSRKYQSIHRVYPYYKYFMIGSTPELLDRLRWYRSLEDHENGTAKVVLVPKDSRGPRLISCEPLEFQWIQQGIGRGLVSYLESLPATRGKINFTRQDINQQLAKVSSTNRSFATVDLKDASDRVSDRVVSEVFARLPKLYTCLEAARTTATKLPDGRVITLKKFAPMGSALCFPVEAYIFWVVMVAAITQELRLSSQRVGERIYVYGDDIVVPTEWVSRCIQALESIGLVVNRDKTCITGFFRESCGVDAYNGTIVTPLRLRKQWTNRKTDGTVLAAYSSLANLLAEKGYFGTSNLIWKYLHGLYGEIPYGTQKASYPCRWAISADKAFHLNYGRFRARYRTDYQRLEFFVPRLSSRKVKTKLNGWPRVLRNMVTPPVGDPSTVVVPRSMRIKRGWAPVG